MDDEGDGADDDDDDDPDDAQCDDGDTSDDSPPPEREFPRRNLPARKVFSSLSHFRREEVAGKFYEVAPR